jgi:hypothetical protein
MFKSYSVILDSVFTRSTAMRTLTAFPHEDLAPLIDWIAERSSKKASRHCSQHSVLLSNLEANSEANLL